MGLHSWGWTFWRQNRERQQVGTVFQVLTARDNHLGCFSKPWMLWTFGTGFKTPPASHVGAPGSESWLPSHCSLLLMCDLGDSSRWWLQCCERPRLRSRLLALAWLSPRHCMHLGGELADGKFTSVSLSFQKWERKETYWFLKPRSIDSVVVLSEGVLKLFMNFNMLVLRNTVLKFLKFCCQASIFAIRNIPRLFVSVYTDGFKWM